MASATSTISFSTLLTRRSMFAANAGAGCDGCWGELAAATLLLNRHDASAQTINTADNMKICVRFMEMNILVCRVKKFSLVLAPRVGRHKVVGAVINDELAVVLATVLDGEGPDVGVVRQPVAEKLSCIVQPCVALLLNHFRAVGDGFLHELNDVGLGLEKVTRRVVALAEVGPEI